MFFECLCRLIIIVFRGVIFDDAVHDFDLTVGPRMTEFSQSMINMMLRAQRVKRMHFVFGAQVISQQFIGELHASTRTSVMSMCAYPMS